MVLIVDFEKKRIIGTATARDIRQLGLIKASIRHQTSPSDDLRIERWSQLFTDTDENNDDDWKPDPNAEEDEEW